MRLLVTGSREWNDFEFLREMIVAKHVFVGEPLVIVHGACPRGADLMASLVADQMAYEEERYPADWDKYGKAAGHIRNKQMVDTNPDAAIAFIRGESRGTKNCIDHLKKAGIHVDIYESE